jgi:hypothetical protein
MARPNIEYIPADGDIELLIGRTVMERSRELGKAMHAEDFDGHRYVYIEGLSNDIPMSYRHNSVIPVLVEEPSARPTPVQMMDAAMAEKTADPAEAFCKTLEERGVMLCNAERARLIEAFAEGQKLGHKEGYATGLREGVNGVVLG